MNTSRLSKLPEFLGRLVVAPVLASSLRKTLLDSLIRPLTIGLFVGIALTSASAAQPAQGRSAKAPEAAAGDLVLHARPGETLIEVAGRELMAPHDWKSLARFNGIRNPMMMPVGQAILIPAAWRKSFVVQATVVSVDGPVRSGGAELKAGGKVSENDMLQTGANAVVVIRLPDGTLVRIPPASQVRIERLRGYHGSEAINARITLDQGGVEVESESSRSGKQPATGREIQIQTPKATASVRGTSFRIGNKPDSAQAEVLDGSVDWTGRSEGRTLGAGLGVVVDSQGRLGKTETLLPKSAALISDSKLEEADAEIEFKPVAGAAQYVLEVARDQEFASLLSQVTQEGNKVLVRSERDGPLYLKVRALSATGLAGFDARFVLDVAARPFYPKVSVSEPAGVNFGKQSALSWNEVAEAVRYRVQVASDERFAHVVTDELTLAPNFKFALNAPISDVTPYYWRVASLDSTRQGPWGSARKMEFAPVMGPVSPQVAEDSVVFEWAGKPGQRFETQLSRDPSFSNVLSSATVQGVSWKASSLPPGQYQMRVRQIFSSGLKGPYGPVLKFDLPKPLLDGSGRPIRGGTGDSIRINN